jgi:hypothetical protein
LEWNLKSAQVGIGCSSAGPPVFLGQPFEPISHLNKARLSPGDLLRGGWQPQAFMLLDAPPGQEILFGKVE